MTRWWWCVGLVLLAATAQAASRSNGGDFPFTDGFEHCTMDEYIGEWHCSSTGSTRCKIDTDCPGSETCVQRRASGNEWDAPLYPGTRAGGAELVGAATTPSKEQIAMNHVIEVVYRGVCADDSKTGCSVDADCTTGTCTTCADNQATCKLAKGFPQNPKHKGDDCAVRLTAYDRDTNGYKETFLQRDVESAGAVTIHAAVNMVGLSTNSGRTQAATRRAIMGNVAADGENSCYIEGEFRQCITKGAGKCATVVGGTVGLNDWLYTARVIYRDNIDRCGSGSRNPFTACTPNDDGRDEVVCAETTSGEARCGTFPIGTTTLTSETWYHVALDEDHGQCSASACSNDKSRSCATSADCAAGLVVCGAYVDGQDIGHQSIRAGTCTGTGWAGDGWACAEDAQCQALGTCGGDSKCTNLSSETCSTDSDCEWTGRCVDGSDNWIKPAGFPVYSLDETTTRCRTTADCATGTCKVQTCDTSLVAALDKTFIGFREDPVELASPLSSFNSSWIGYYNDWVGMNAFDLPTSGIRKVRVRDLYPVDYRTNNGDQQTWARSSSPGCTSGESWDCVDPLATLVNPLVSNITRLIGNEDGGSSTVDHVDIEFQSNTSEGTDPLVLWSSTCDCTTTDCIGNLDPCTCCTGAGVGSTCGATNVCAEGHCSSTRSTTCTSNGDCPSGETCEIGVCFADDDCKESIDPDMPLTFVGLFADSDEGCSSIGDNQGGTKSVRPLLYDANNTTSGEPTSGDCPSATCQAGDDVVIGTNLCSDDEPSGEQNFTNPWGGGTPSWSTTGTEINNGVGIGLVYTDEPGSNKQIKTPAMVVSFPVTLPSEPCAKVLPDRNGDGRITVGLIGDSTYADSALEAVLLGEICEPDDLLMQSAGSLTLGDAHSYWTDILDGSGDATLVKGGLHASALRGAACTAGGSTCNGLDITVIGMGINSIHGRLRQAEEGYCHNPEQSDSGGRCQCPQSSASVMSSASDTGVCLKAPPGTTSGKTAFKGSCSTDSDCTTGAGASGGQDNFCFPERYTCVSGACSGTYWGGFSESCSASNRCAGDHTTTCTTTSDCTTANVDGPCYSPDCDVFAQWCGQGCTNSPGCGGVCFQDGRQSMAGIMSHWTDMIDTVDERNTWPSCNDTNECARVCEDWSNVACDADVDCASGVCGAASSGAGGTCDGSSQCTGDDTFLVMVAQASGDNADTYLTGACAGGVCEGSGLSCSSGADCSQDLGCWWGAHHVFNELSGRVIEMAKARKASGSKIGWIDHNAYARDNCPGRLRASCTRDGIHMDDANGVGVFSDILNKCLQNINGTSSTYYDCNF